MDKKQKHLENALVKSVKEVSYLVGHGEPLDGDQTEQIANLFRLLLDKHNGNIINEEFGLELLRINFSIL